MAKAHVSEAITFIPCYKAEADRRTNLIDTDDIHTKRLSRSYPKTLKITQNSHTLLAVKLEDKSNTSSDIDGEGELLSRNILQLGCRSLRTLM